MTDDDTPALQQRLAAALGEHHYLHVNNGGKTGCRGCHWTFPLIAQSVDARRAHDRHLARDVVVPLVLEAEATLLADLEALVSRYERNHWRANRADLYDLIEKHTGRAPA